MKLTLEQRLIRNPRILYNMVDGEAVLIDPERGKVRVLNEVAGRMWELIDGRRSVAEIAALLAGEYATEVGKIEQDALVFFEELKEKGLCR